jgi:hypothetical protein
MMKLSNAKSTNVPAKTGRVLHDVNNAPSAPTNGSNRTALAMWNADVDKNTTIVSADGKSVNDVFSVRPSKNGERRKMAVTFDFANCSMEEIVKLATSTLRIDVQREYRDAGGEPNQNDAARWNRTIDVHAMVNAPRATAVRDPRSNVVNALESGKITPDELRAIIAAMETADAKRNAA